ncbi:MAG: MaoC like domain [Actinomycetota bacterium]|jgi:acyl dehydratase|nr:MaoC like domain [Actinomycetota bacterium]
MPSRTDERLPFLPLSGMRAGRTFGPGAFVVTPGLVAAYIEVTGDDHPVYTDDAAARAAGFDGCVLPPGLTGVWARRSYLTEHRMLPGGVMAGETVELLLPVTVGARLSIMAEVVESDPDDERRRVVLACTARDEGGRLAGRVEIDARWPEDPS